MEHIKRYYSGQLTLFATLVILFFLSIGKPRRMTILKDAWKARNQFETPWDSLESVAIMGGFSRIAQFCDEKSTQDWEYYVLNYK